MADWSLSGRRTRFNSRLNKRRRNEIKVKEEKPRGQKASSSHSGTVVSSVLSQRLGNRRSAGSSLFLCQTGSGCLSCSRVNVCFICSTISKNSTHTFTRLSVRSFLFSSSHFSSLPFFSHILQKTYFSGCYWLFYFSISCSTITLCDWLTDWLIDSVTDLFICIYFFIFWIFGALPHSCSETLHKYVTVATLTAANMTWLKSQTAVSRLAAILLQVSSSSFFLHLLLLPNKVEQLIWGEDVVVSFLFEEVLCVKTTSVNIYNKKKT